MSLADTSFYREPPRRDGVRWLVAATVVVALHVLLAVALLYRQPAEPTEPTGDVVELDLTLPQDEQHAAPTAATPVEAAVPHPDETKPDESKPDDSKPDDSKPEPTEQTPPPPPVAAEPPPAPASPPVEPPTPVEPPPPEPTPAPAAVAPVPDLPVMPAPAAVLEAQQKAERLAEQKKEDDRKRLQQQRLAEQRRDDAQRKQEDARRREATKAKENAKRAAERKEAASRAKEAAQRGRDQREAQRRAGSASLGSWIGAVQGRVRSAAAGYAGESSGASTVSFFVTAGGGVSRVSGSGAAASAVRSMGSVQPPPDGVGHPVSVTVRFQ